MIRYMYSKFNDIKDFKTSYVLCHNIYLSGHMLSGFNVGDRVRVIKTEKSRSYMWNDVWTDNMTMAYEKSYIGNVIVDEEDNVLRGIPVYFNQFRRDYVFPYWCLMKVPD